MSEESSDEEGEDEEEEEEDEEDSLQPGIYRPWSTYLCSCYENCVNCVFVPLCLPWFLCELFHYVFGHKWWKSAIMAIFLFPFIPFVLIGARRQIRVKHQLQGNILVDIFCSLLCPFCSSCQVRDEITTLRRDHQWRLPNKPPPGPPKHSIYISPLVEFCGEIRQAIKDRKAAKKGADDSESESGSSSSDDDDDDDESGGSSDGSSSGSGSDSEEDETSESCSEDESDKKKKRRKK